MWLLTPSVFNLLEQLAQRGVVPTAEQQLQMDARSSSGNDLLKVSGKTAVINIDGVLTDKPDFFATFFGGGNTPGTGWKPTNFYSMDYEGFNYRDNTAGNYPGIFRPKDCYFYLAVSSVRDFFVESEVLVDFRVQGITEAEKSKCIFFK